MGDVFCKLREVDHHHGFAVGISDRRSSPVEEFALPPPAETSKIDTKESTNDKNNDKTQEECKGIKKVRQFIQEQMKQHLAEKKKILEAKPSGIHLQRGLIEALVEEFAFIGKVVFRYGTIHDVDTNVPLVFEMQRSANAAVRLTNKLLQPSCGKTNKKISKTN